MGGKRVLMVISPDGFREEELFEPQELLVARGAKVTIASIDGKIAEGMAGATVQPDLRIAQVRLDDYDAILIVGGSGAPDHLWENRPLLDLVRAAALTDKLIGAECLASPVLAYAGVLQGKRATSWPGVHARDVLQQQGATYVGNDQVVVDGRMVTSPNPSRSRAFGEAVAKGLGL